MESVFFSVYKSKYEKSHTGILLASVGYDYDHSLDGNVCSSAHQEAITPSLESANIICQYVNINGDYPVNNPYHRAEWVASTDDDDGLPMTVFEDLHCYDSTTAGNHQCSTNQTSSDCLNTKISCACNESYYRTNTGCLSCPLNSFSDGSDSRCACNTGYYQYITFTEEYRCAKCGVNTYSAENSTLCTLCPDGTTTDGLDGATGSHWCVYPDSTCSSGQTEIKGYCVHQAGIGAAIFLPIAAIVLIIWRYIRYQAVLRFQKKHRETILQDLM